MADIIFNTRREEDAANIFIPVGASPTLERRWDAVNRTRRCGSILGDEKFSTINSAMSFRWRLRRPVVTAYKAVLGDSTRSPSFQNIPRRVRFRELEKREISSQGRR